MSQLDCQRLPLQMKLRDGIRLAMAVSADGNKFFTETEPFKVVKSDPQHAATLVAAGEGVNIHGGVGRQELSQQDLGVETCLLVQCSVQCSVHCCVEWCGRIPGEMAG